MKVPTSHFPLLLSNDISWSRHYAEIEIAGSRWLPWPGRTSRWWFEISKIAPDETGSDVDWTLAYEPGGSGGGFTLAACLRRASAALDRFDDAVAEATSDGL